MKRMKLFLAFLLSFVMLMSSSLGALAADGDENTGGESGDNPTSTTTTITNVPTPDGGFTLTIKGNPKDHGIHTYEAYQILSGTLAMETDGTNVRYILSDIKWANGISGAGRTALGGDTNAAATAYAKTLTDVNIAAEADTLSEYLVGENKIVSTYDADTNTYTITGLLPGFYLIQDAEGSPSLPEGENVDEDEYLPAAKTKYIMRVLNNVIVDAKSSVPSVTKKVKEMNDTTGIETGWQDAADYDIGDEIPYKLEGTLPDTFADYNYYKVYTFVDTLSDGLTPPDAEDIQIVLDTEDGVDIKSLFDIDITGQVITISLKEGVDLKTAKVTSGDTEVGFTKDSKIIVLYSATLNENAIIGSAGNPNTLYLEFTNNPNNDSEGSGKTPKDLVTVFTYQLQTVKVAPDEGSELTQEQYDELSDEDKALYVEIGNKYYKTEPLEGAGFTLFKYVEPEADNGGAGTDNTEPTTEGQEPGTDNTEPTTEGQEPGTDNTEPTTEGQEPGTDNTEPTTEGQEPGTDNTEPTTEPESTEDNASDENWVAVGPEVSGVTEFNFKGIDAGKYKLVETTVPPGYNTVEPIFFEVIAEYETNSDNPKLLKLEVETEAPNEGLLTINNYTETLGEADPDTGNMTVIEVTTNGIISGTIINLKGTVLPGTGGIGTTPFYVVGGILVLAAGIWLIVKRRMKTE